MPTDKLTVALASLDGAGQYSRAHLIELLDESARIAGERAAVDAAAIERLTAAAAVARDDSDAIAKLRAKVAELEARPALTVERLAEAIHDARDVSTFIAIETAKEVMAKLGPVTLPAPGPDAAEFLIDKMRSYGWASLGLLSSAADDLRRAIAAMPKPAPSTSPPPADVFAGVSVDALVSAYMVAYFTSKAGDAVANRAGIEAVVARLGASLVAPVDPEAMARDYHNDGSGPSDLFLPQWGNISLNARDAATNAMRSTLDRAGIPVTPEAGK